MKATQEKSLHQTSELHAKELEVLQSQVNKLKEELSSSRDKSQELEKLVSELQAYKEQAQVSTDCHMYTCVSPYNIFYWNRNRNLFDFCKFFLCD